MSDSLSPADTSIAALPPGDLWVFAYGSLMWNTGFDHEEKITALLRGGHRALCILSTHYRGTPEVPGLDRGGSCRGIAFRVAAEKAATAYAYLTAREMLSQVYAEKWRMLQLEDGRRVKALTYFADPLHPQYVRLSSREEILRRIERARGSSGPCREYVLATLLAIRQIGVRDHSLDWLSDALVALT